jgi:hypothetical protein
VEAAVTIAVTAADATTAPKGAAVAVAAASAGVDSCARLDDTVPADQQHGPHQVRLASPRSPCPVVTCPTHVCFTRCVQWPHSSTPYLCICLPPLTHCTQLRTAMACGQQGCCSPTAPPAPSGSRQ